MSVMTDALERISRYCHLSKLNKTREEVQRELSFFPFQLSEEVYEFYQWAGAPVGKQFPEDWDGQYNDNSTYNCALESFLGSASDLIHFLSLEEAESVYSGFSIYPNLYNIKCLPFVSYENGFLVIAGSQTQIEVSPVLQRESRDELWFPSLTDMMLAIAESIEIIGTLFPSYNYDENGETPDRREVDKKRDKLTAIAQKYGSPQGIIITN